MFLSRFFTNFNGFFKFVVERFYIYGLRDATAEASGPIGF